MDISLRVSTTFPADQFGLNGALLSMYNPIVTTGMHA